MKKIPREKVIEAIVKYRLKFISNKELKNTLDYSTGDMQADLYNTITDEYSGVSNGFLSDFYKTLTGNTVEVVGTVRELFACPCCGFETLSEIYNVNEGTGYDICEYCHWEDDGTTDIRKKSSVNHGSMQDFQNNIRNNYNYFYKNKWNKKR